MVVGAEQDVGGLDVAVDDAARVRGVERAADLGDDVRGARRVQALRGAHERAQVASPRRSASRCTATAVALARVVDRDDVAGGRSRRRRATRATKRSRNVGVLGQLRGDELQRDGAVEVELERAVDHAHAAAARDPQDAVAGELVSLVQGGHRVFVQQGPHAPARPLGSAAADILGLRRCAVRAPFVRPRGGQWCSATAAPFVRRRLRLPPPVVTAAAAAAPLALSVAMRRSQLRDVAVVRACRCTPTSRPTRCPTTIPSACARACACAIPWSPTAPSASASCRACACSARFARHEGEPLRAAEQALVWCHWLWFFVPHGTVAYLLARRRDQLRRAAPRRSTRSSTSGSSATGRSRPRRRGTRPSRASSGRAEPERAPPDARARTGGLEGRLGPSLRCPGRQPSRRHALPALRDIRDGRPRPQRRRAGAGRRWAGPTPARSGFALVYLGEHYVIDLARRPGAGRGRAAPGATAPRRRCARSAPALQRLEARAHA